MIPSEVSTLAKRIFKMSAILIMLSAFVVLVMGYSAGKINHEIKILSTFLNETENVGTNFEQSLQLYTEGTAEAITHIHALRPGEESDYIEFISDIETLGDEMGIDLSLRSITIDPPETSTKGSTLDYQLSFYGSQKNTIEFLDHLENLSYYIKVYSVDYSDLNYLDENDNAKLSENIKIKIRLYVK